MVTCNPMDTINHFEQNRPVHLARRDVYYETAAALLCSPFEKPMLHERIDHFEEVLFALRTARRHAKFAIRADGGSGKNHEFYQHIALMVGNVKAVLSMLNQKLSVENAEGFFFSFLGVNHASVVLQAEEYERRAKDIINCIHNTCELSKEPYEQLKASYKQSSTLHEQARYQTAREHFQQLVLREQEQRQKPDESTLHMMMQEA